MKILNRLPYAAAPTTITIRGETQRMRPYQIIVWVSINVRAMVEWDPRLPQVPAILDTGNNHNFSITRSQLLRWAGIQPEALPPRGTIQEGGQRIPLHAAALWLYPNVPGESQTSGREPHALDLKG